MREKILKLLANVIITMGVVIIMGLPHKTAYAADGIVKVSENVRYNVDLDTDGVMEELRFKVTDSHKIKIYINGKVKKNINTSEYSWGHEIRVVDLDKKDGYVDFFVYCWRWSRDLELSALYRYQDGKIKKIWKGDNHPINSTDGKGYFYCSDIIYDASNLVGTQFIKIKYQLKDGKVKKKSKNTFSFIEPIFTSDDYSGKGDGGLILRGNTKFYKTHDSNGETFKVKGKTKTYPIKVYISDDNKVYVQYRIGKTSKKGWLCTEDWPNQTSDENSPFTNYFTAG